MGIVDQVAKFGIKPGANIRFVYAMGDMYTERRGEIISVRDAKEVKQKTGITANTSLYLCILKTADGVKSFWEAGMMGVELV